MSTPSITNRFAGLVAGRWYLGLVAIALVWGQIGCGQGSSRPPRPTRPSTESADTETPAQGKSTATSTPGKATSSAVTVKPVDRAEYDAVIASHRGKAILVDCWATWCGPCKKGFPATVALSKQHPDDLVVISLSFDDLEADGTAPAKVGEFLASQQANFPHLISKLDLADEATHRAFDIADGSIPNLKLYGRDGKLIKTFTGGTFTHEEIESAVQAAIAK